MNLTTATLREYEILPAQTDKAIDEWLEPHYVAVDTSVAAQQKLFLFLCGSHGNTSRQRLIVQQAAKLGYHAINLRYPNSWRITDLCAVSTDCDCQEKVRLAIINGSQGAGELKISRANSLTNRLVKLLVYLYEQNPSEGWLQYLEGLSLHWQKVVVAGHSQGGGQAAMIAKDHLVARVIMFAAPADYNRLHDSPVPWLSKEHVTPAERYYGFAHWQDAGFPKILQAWQCLGLASYGAPVNVDEQAFPYGYSHQLFTNLGSLRRRHVHGSVVVDAATPKLSNSMPKFQEVWQYLLSARKVMN